MPVKIEARVVSEGEWHRAQPILRKRFEPFCVGSVCGPGVGGADRRMKAAKFAVSDSISDAVPIVVPLFGLALLLLTRLVESSGISLNTQPGIADRSFGNNSLVTPCSTL